MTKIGTHNNTFHCDDAMAVALLKVLPKFKDATVSRSRDPKEWDTCDIIVDVSGEYSHEKCRYDHHQKSFSLVLSDIKPNLKDKDWANSIKLSSAGLVYAHYGEEILKILTPNELDAENVEYQTQLFKFVYKGLIREIDAIDNGVDQYSGENLVKNYSISTNLGNRVRRLNVDWQDTNPDYNKNFPKANEICLEEFKHRINGFHSWWKAREIVLHAVKTRYEIDNSGKIIYLSQYCPWRAHLEEFEDSEIVPKEEILYVLYGEGENYRVLCVGKEPGSFENRKSLPKEWCGLRDDQLSKISGIPGMLFVHANGFTGGCKTRDGLLRMVRASVAL